ncbi:hypothetical protein DXG01_007019 [Tephrocybe rancida]|nr:hypothetical protein DXG01_007019 [Tephrocybe rancida]
MSAPPKLPNELILEAVESHLEDRPSLSACSLSASFLQSACQKKLFSSLKLVLGTSYNHITDQSDIIVMANPRIPSYVESLQLDIQEHDKVPSFLVSLDNLRSLMLSSNALLSTKMLEAVTHLLHLATLSSIQFLPEHEKGNLLPSSILNACSGVNNVILDVIRPFLPTLEPHTGAGYGAGTYIHAQSTRRSPGACTTHMHIFSGHLLQQIINEVNITALKSLDVRVSAEYRNIVLDCLQSLINGASSSLNRLFLNFSCVYAIYVQGVEFIYLFAALTYDFSIPISLSQLSRLSTLWFHVGAEGVRTAFDCICGMLLSMDRKEQFREVGLSLVESEYDVGHGICWNRLVRILTEQFPSAMLSILANNDEDWEYLYAPTYKTSCVAWKGLADSGSINYDQLTCEVWNRSMEQPSEVEYGRGSRDTTAPVAGVMYQRVGGEFLAAVL